MPPALAQSDDDRETAASDGPLVTKARRQSTRSNGASIINGTERRTRANAAKPERALALASANGPDGELNNGDEEEEEEEYEDGDSEDEETAGFLSKPKLPPHQFASRSLFEIVGKYACCEVSVESQLLFVSTEVIRMLRYYLQNFFPLPTLISILSINEMLYGKVSTAPEIPGTPS